METTQPIICSPTDTVTAFDANQINWVKVEGKVPVIIQHYQTHAVLMLGYMNQEALQITLTHKRVTFYSRTRQKLWEKGETSGHYLKLIHIFLDCDQDTLLIMADPAGPTCHLGHENCFNTPIIQGETFLGELQTVIQQRHASPSANSYTSQLFTQGISRIAQKVGEEAIEVAIAAVSADSAELLEESADLIFHWLVLLTAKSLTLNNVIAVLQRRHQAKNLSS